MKPGLYVVLVHGVIMFPVSQHGEAGSMILNKLQPEDVVLVLGIESQYSSRFNKEIYTQCMHKGHVVEVAIASVEHCMQPVRLSDE